jgi:hypothetical protein
MHGNVNVNLWIVMHMVIIKHSLLFQLHLNDGNCSETLLQTSLQGIHCYIQ